MKIVQEDIMTFQCFSLNHFHFQFELHLHRFKILNKQSIITSVTAAASLVWTVENVCCSASKIYYDFGWVWFCLQKNRFAIKMVLWSLLYVPHVVTVSS